MRNTRIRSIVVFIVTIAFLCGLGLFVFRYIMNANTWAASSVNKYISGSEMVSAGKILDRNGVVLAESDGRRRLYNSDKDVRKAVLHTVGDASNYISTSIQNIYGDTLMGYNLITGFGLPQSLKGSNSIKTTLDSELCRIASLGLSTNKGCVMIYNYLTGEVVCMVSSPTYDPYNKPEIIDSSNESYNGVYLNRCLSASFTPGSIFKIITAVSAIDNISNIENRTFVCNGSINVDGAKVTCMSKHGKINLKDAMAKSCNIAFAELAMELGKHKMTQTANEVEFNCEHNLDKMTVAKSNYDVSQAKNVDLAWSGIGQYTDLVNPMHMMMLMGAVVNGGTCVRPYIIDSIEYSKFSMRSHMLGNSKVTLIKESTANTIRDILRYTVKNNYGDRRFPNLNVCAKTGTGEIGEGKKPNGWIIGASLDKDCPLAFAVIVEESGFGISTAAPIATQVMSAAAKRLRK